MSTRVAYALLALLVTSAGCRSNPSTPDGGSPDAQVADASLTDTSPTTDADEPDARICDGDSDGHEAVWCGGDDCIDSESAIHPGVAETCNGSDEDCDTRVDEGVLATYYADCDGDGSGAGAPVMACTAPSCAGHPAVVDSLDCDDVRASVHAGSVEVCNGRDDDCDGDVDDAAAADASCAGSVTGATVTACVDGRCEATVCETTHLLCAGVCASTALSETCDLAPRAIAPTSTATVTSRRPTLRWALAAGSDGARVELCRDRACTVVIHTVDVTGSSAAPPSDLPTGVVFWRLRSRTGASTSAITSPTWQFVVGARSAAVDTAWGTTLDVNGDGYADLAVGAKDESSSTGAVYVYLGSASGLAAAPHVRLLGLDGFNATFGSSVASAGDVNGDGYSDLAVGAPNASSTLGRAYVYLGGPLGLATTPATMLTGMDGAYTRLGGTVASAGDVNRDGYADLAVGAVGAGGVADAWTGRVYLYLGGAGGLATSPASMWVGPDGIDGRFGSALASGDLNGDGYSDLAIGAHTALSSRAGRTYVYLGGASGLPTTASSILAAPEDGGLFGFALATGDLNGDGYADLAVGAPQRRRVYVYHGGASGLGASPAADLRHVSEMYATFGTSVASMGDINGDGYADLGVGGANATRVGADPVDRAYVYLGSATGITSFGMPATTLMVPTGVFSEAFGFSLASLRDVNGDGYADLVVGAYYASDGRYLGRAFVYLGSATGLASSPATTLDGPGGAASDFGWSLAAASELRVTSSPRA